MPTPCPKPAPRTVSVGAASAAAGTRANAATTAAVLGREAERIRCCELGRRAKVAVTGRLGDRFGRTAGIGRLRGVPGGGGRQVRLRDPGRGDARPQPVAGELLRGLPPRSTRTGR